MKMFDEVEKNISDGTLVSELDITALPSLYEHYVKLINYLAKYFCCNHKSLS